MSIDSASFQFSAAYGSAMVKTKPAPMKNLSFENAVPIPLEKGTWEDLWEVKSAETVGGDGTVTKTMSGGVSIIGPDARGSAVFSVGVSFDPGTYQDGELGETVDLLSAAHAAAEAALRSAFSGEERDEQLNRLEVVYQQRKAEASNSFAAMAGGRLEADFQTGEEERKVYNSVQALFASYESKYQAVIKENRQESWMGENLSVSTANLRKLAAFSLMDGGGVNGLYSLRELEAAAATVCKGFSFRA